MRDLAGGWRLEAGGRTPPQHHRLDWLHPRIDGRLFPNFAIGGATVSPPASRLPSRGDRRLSPTDSREEPTVRKVLISGDPVTGLIAGRRQARCAAAVQKKKGPLTAQWHGRNSLSLNPSIPLATVARVTRAVTMARARIEILIRGVMKFTLQSGYRSTDWILPG